LLGLQPAWKRAHQGGRAVEGQRAGAQRLDQGELADGARAAAYPTSEHGLIEIDARGIKFSFPGAVDRS
jgi:hypothetical protein